MPVKLRLARHGAKKNPYYRLVATDQRTARDGRYLEHIGSYDPTVDPPAVRLERERIQLWLDHGAQPSATVKKLLNRYMEAEDTAPRVPPNKRKAGKPAAKVEVPEEAKAETPSEVKGEEPPPEAPAGEPATAESKAEADEKRAEAAEAEKPAEAEKKAEGEEKAEAEKPAEAEKAADAEKPAEAEKKAEGEEKADAETDKPTQG
ncbi:MAG: 30S ribosomal protein S16 [Myxococcota bacterium]